jgi:cobaltochelatase CobN
MHLLTTSSANLDEIVEAVDLGQTPGDIVVLSFADSDLAGLAAAWRAERAALPSVRLAHLRDLRHPMSVDLWIDRVASHAKVIVVRLLGGLEWWKYGIERLSVLARERSIAFAVLPGEDRDDARLTAVSTLPAKEVDTLLRFFREGGRENLRLLLRRCPALRVISPVKARSISIASRRRSSRTMLSYRSFSIAPYCLPAILRRLTHSARRSTNAVSHRRRYWSRA